MLLEELDLPYEVELVEFSNVKKPEYLEVTPNGRLPTIKDPKTGILLWEVKILLRLSSDCAQRANKIGQ